MKSGIYKLHWNNCGYFYYGQSNNLDKRKSGHIRSLVTGTHRNKKLQRVFNKYGSPLFEVIEKCEIGTLTEREQIHISEHFKNKYCCNLTPNAGTCTGYVYTKKQCLERSLRQKGRVVSEETKMKISNSHFGIKHSEKTKKLISEIQIGKVRSQQSIERMKATKLKNDSNKRSEETKQKIRNTLIGHSVSEETRAKLSRSNKGRPVSEETRKKISKFNKGKIISPETAQKIRESKLGKPRSLECRMKISETARLKRESRVEYMDKKINEVPEIQNT